MTEMTFVYLESSFQAHHTSEALAVKAVLLLVGTD